jgi:hypothetical protein
MPGLIDAHMHSAAGAGAGLGAGGGAVDGTRPMGRCCATPIPPTRRWARSGRSWKAWPTAPPPLPTTRGPWASWSGATRVWGAAAWSATASASGNFANREQWIAQGWKPGDPTPLDAEAGRASLERSPAALRRVGRARRGAHPGDLRARTPRDFLSREMLLRVQAEARKRGAPAASARGPGPAREQRHPAALRAARHPVSRVHWPAGAGSHRGAPLHRHRGRGGGPSRAAAPAWSAAPTPSASSTA